MATIPKEWIDTYDTLLAGASNKVQSRVLESLRKVDFADIANARNEIISIFEYYLPTAMEESGEIAAMFYDSCRELCTGETMGAQIDTGYNPEADNQAVRGMIQEVVDGGDEESFFGKLLERVDSQMKRAAYNTTMFNAKNDKKHPRFARVPGYSKSYGAGCPFCIMLASRGFVYYSKETAGEGDHWHGGCTCKVICSWNNSDVEGYDQSAYEKQYQEMSKEQKAAMRQSAENYEAATQKRQTQARIRYRTRRSEGWTDYRTDKSWKYEE